MYNYCLYRYYSFLSNITNNKYNKVMKPKPIGKVHLKGTNDKEWAKYKANLNAKPKEYNNLWLHLRYFDQI